MILSKSSVYVSLLLCLLTVSAKGLDNDVEWFQSAQEAVRLEIQNEVGAEYVPDQIDVNFCEQYCGYDAPWDDPEYFCGTDGRTRWNSACQAGYNIISCWATIFHESPSWNPLQWGVASAGACGCPSNCSTTKRGICDAATATCSCQPGYTGSDCATVTCSGQSNSCNNRGKCSQVTFDDPTKNIDSCYCNKGYSAADCSAEMAPFPPIVQTLNYPQYSSKDEYGDDHPIWNTSTIAQIHIQIAPKDLKKLILPSNMDDRDYMHVNFTFFNGAVKEQMNNVGMRVKGGASRAFAKKSWKLSFNAFEKGRKWFGQNKLPLKATSMTPMYVRELSSIAGLKSMGAPAQRASFANIYINGESWGLYTMFEDPGRDEYLNSRFGTAKGALWKCSGTLRYLGDDPVTYQNLTINGGPQYKPMTEKAEESFLPLLNFIEVLNLTPDDQFEDAIQQVFDVEFFLRTLVVEVLTGNWDGIQNGNNYFLYQNTDGLFYYYRHDMDLAFGSFDQLMRSSTKNIWEWGKLSRGFTLINKILGVASFRNIYADYMTQLMKTYLNEDQNGPFFQRMIALHTQVASSVEMDYWHRLDKQLGYEVFQTNLDKDAYQTIYVPPNPYLPRPELPGYKAYSSVSDFLNVRMSSAREQLANPPPN